MCSMICDQPLVNQKPLSLENVTALRSFEYKDFSSAIPVIAALEHSVCACNGLFGMYLLVWIIS